MANPPGFFVDETGRAHVPFSTGTTAAPATGTWVVGNLAVTTAGVLYVCTVAGSPGTWAVVSGGGGAAEDVTFTPAQGIAATNVQAAIEETVTDAAATYAALALPKSTQTNDYTTVLGDAGTIIEGNKATAMTFTIPPNSSVAYPLNTVMEFCQLGAGAITVAAGSGVTFDGGNATTTAQYQSLFARQRATDEWVITGSVQLGEIGYAAITADVTQAAVGNALVAGMSSTVTAPGGRPLLITASAELKQSTSGSGVAMTIEEDGTQVLELAFIAAAANQTSAIERSVRRVPAAGLHTYRVRLYATTSGTGTLLASATNPAFIQVVQV